MLFVICGFLFVLLGNALVDVNDPIAMQALYSRISVSGTTPDTLTDILRSAGVTPDWVQRSAAQLSQASGIDLQTIFNLVNTLVPPSLISTYGLAPSLYNNYGLPPSPSLYNNYSPLSPNNPYYGYPLSPTPFNGFASSSSSSLYPPPPPPPPQQQQQQSTTTSLQQLLERVRLYGTTKDSFEKLLRASKIDLNVIKTSFADFVYASGLAWTDVQDVYMKLKLGDACSPNPCASGTCIPNNNNLQNNGCVSCPLFSCVIMSPPTFPEISPTNDPAALKVMLQNVAGDPRLLAQYLPAIAAKSGMNIAKVTDVVSMVISDAAAASAQLGNAVAALTPEDSIMQVAAKATSPPALFDGLQRVLASLQGSVDPTAYASLIPDIARVSQLTQAQISQVFADLARTSRGSFISAPSPPTSMYFGSGSSSSNGINGLSGLNGVSGAFFAGVWSPTPAKIVVATDDQISSVVSRLGPGIDAKTLESTLAQSGVPIPQLGTRLQQIATITRLPTPVISGILTHLLTPGLPSAATLYSSANSNNGNNNNTSLYSPYSSSPPPTPAITYLPVEYVISALIPGMSVASVIAALQQVKDFSTIGPYRSYISSRTNLSPQAVDSLLASMAPSTPAPSSPPPTSSSSSFPPFAPSPAFGQSPFSSPTPSLLPPSPAPPLAPADKQVLDSLAPTSPQALFFSLKSLSVPALSSGAYTNQIASATQIPATTVVRVVAAVLQSLASDSGAPVSGSAPTSALAPTLSAGGWSNPSAPSASPVMLYPTPSVLYPTPSVLYPTPSVLYPTPSVLYPTPSTFPPPTPAFASPTPLSLSPTPRSSIPSGPSPTPYSGPVGSPLAFIATLPTGQPPPGDVYTMLASAPFSPTALLDYVPQMATQTGLDAPILQSMLNTVIKINSAANPSATPAASTDDFDSVLGSLKDGMTIDEVQTILTQQIANPRTLSTEISRIVFRTGLEEGPVGDMIQAMIKAKPTVP